MRNVHISVQNRVVDVILRFMVAGAPILVLQSGCTTSEQYRSANQLVENQEYDKAVSELRQLVAAEPRNSDYQILLAEAESKAADRHVARAEQLRAQAKPRDARTELKTALDLVPADPKAITMLREVENDILRADEKLREAQAAMSRHEMTAADRLAEEALRIDQGLVAARQIRERTQGSAGTMLAEMPVERTQPKQPPQVSAAQQSPATQASAAPAPQPPPPPPPPPSESPPPPPDLRPSSRGYQGIISRDDSRYKKEISTLDGIILKVKDTSHDPVTADLEIRVGQTKSRQNTLPVGTRILIRGLSGKRYELVVQSIDDTKETVRFSMQETNRQSLSR